MGNFFGNLFYCWPKVFLKFQHKTIKYCGGKENFSKGRYMIVLQANIWHWTMSPEYTYTVEKLFLQLGSADNNGLEIGSFNGFWPVVQ